ncbi:uncharacterized protein LOC133038682 [Cannabis sativa]|uniref:uncharacterized protein LOC133038682 n=1 Tax=Cannabis sativa TaxID=3483 RepID=UPI0029C9DED0|nr:uncharacterized protein LOC133038682 [Cannabis sativa]
MNVLFDRLASKDVLEFFRGNNKANLKKLKSMLRYSDVLLNDAEQKLGDDNVKKWLEDLKEVVYEAQLPDSIDVSVCVLEALSLGSCQKLTQLSTNISELIFLRYLYIFYDTPLKEMLPMICNMIKELGKLTNLHGRLFISRLEYVKEVNDVLKDSLMKKKLSHRAYCEIHGISLNSSFRVLEEIHLRNITTSDWSFINTNDHHNGGSEFISRRMGSTILKSDLM